MTDTKKPVVEKLGDFDDKTEPKAPEPKAAAKPVRKVDLIAEPGAPVEFCIARDTYRKGHIIGEGGNGYGFDLDVEGEIKPSARQGGTVLEAGEFRLIEGPKVKPVTAKG